MGELRNKLAARQKKLASRKRTTTTILNRAQQNSQAIKRSLAACVKEANKGFRPPDSESDDEIEVVGVEEEWSGIDNSTVSSF